jgi:phage tail-like protein
MIAADQEFYCQDGRDEGIVSRTLQSHGSTGGSQIATGIGGTMPISSTHYPSHNYVLYLEQSNGQSAPLGGFSEVPGLAEQIAVAEYRNGSVQGAHVQKVPGASRYSDVTLTRGIVAAPGLSNWAGSVGGHSAGSPSPGHPSRLPGLQKVGDVTLKRGVVDSSSLSNWINSARGGGSVRGHLIIVLRNQAGMPVKSWKLKNAAPLRYAGPTLAGKGTDVAIEELVLSIESIEIVPHHHR